VKKRAGKARALALALGLGTFGCSEQNRPVQTGSSSPTWNDDVAPIIYRHCLPCHLPEAAAPFPLTTRSDAAKRGRQIVEVTASGFMPPWLPDEDGPRIRGERRMTAEETQTLAVWVANGAPVGVGPEPTPPEVQPWPLGTPDETLEVSGSVIIPAEGDGTLHTLVLPIDFGEPRHLIASQFLPSTPRALHGVGWLFDTSGHGLRADPGFPGSGYRDMGGAGMNTIGSLGGWVPGRSAIPLLEDYSFLVEGKGAILVQLHLNGTGKPERESSKLGLYYSEEPRKKNVIDFIMGSLLMDIDPNESNYVLTDEVTLPVDTELLGLYPKARYVCTHLHVSAIGPKGNTTLLLRISDYNYDWVEPYWYAQPQDLLAGTRIKLEYVYDNSSNNLRNPHHPPRRISLGRDAEDEMAFLMLYLATEDPSDLATLEELHRDGFQRRIRALKNWRAEH
jgi:hypothetical protein